MDFQRQTNRRLYEEHAATLPLPDNLLDDDTERELYGAYAAG